MNFFTGIAAWSMRVASIGSSRGELAVVKNSFSEQIVYSGRYLFQPTDHHIYLLRNSAHPSHCTRAIPFGVATRVRRNCSAIGLFRYIKIQLDSEAVRTKTKEVDDVKDNAPAPRPS